MVVADSSVVRPGKGIHCKHNPGHVLRTNPPVKSSNSQRDESTSRHSAGSGLSHKDKLVLVVEVNEGSAVVTVGQASHFDGQSKDTN